MKAGSRLGPYEVISALGAGGMGEVYRARDERLGRDVAIKVLPVEVAADAERLARFEREARALAALSHHNILGIFDFGKETLSLRGAAGPEAIPSQEITYAVTELLEGETLRERLRRERLPWRKAMEIAAAIADGLAAAHGKGIVHRDLKPDNVFVTSDGRVKILDFGLARLAASPLVEAQTFTSPPPGTLAGAVLGTVGYMAPEQVRGEAADARSDIFALGCVLYEMLTGERAFKRDTAAETMTAILREPAPEVSTSGVVATPELNRIVAHCLEKQPAERFQSASDVAFALRSLAADRAVMTVAQAGSTEDSSASLSIVVLPFDNLSPDPENAFFADGLTEELIADLSKVRALRVISRTSAMLLKGSGKDVPTIARDLNVRYVLEGSVRFAGQNLRITAQLIDAVTDGHVWAEKYAGSLADVFDMQEKASRAIVEALRLELTPQEHRRMAERPIPNVYAYECYLKARREIWHFVEPSLLRAGGYLEEGLRVLPDNPLLLAGMGYVHFQRANLGFGQEDDLMQAESFANRALEIAPDLPEGHLVLGLVAAWCRGKIQAAIAHFEQVLAEDPNNQDVLKWAGSIYPHVGRLAEATAMGERVIAADPMSPMSYMPLLFSRWLDGDYGAALEVLDRAWRADPSAAVLDSLRILLLIPMGRHDEVFALTKRIEDDQRSTIDHRCALFLRYALVGEREKALSWMSPEALATSRRDMQYSWWVACGYALLGDANSALDWLENAVERGFLNHRYLAEIDPILAPLRSDPRFQAVVARAKDKRAELEGRP